VETARFFSKYSALAYSQQIPPIAGIFGSAGPLEKATFINVSTVFAFWRADLQLQIGAARATPRRFAIPPPLWSTRGPHTIANWRAGLQIGAPICNFELSRLATSGQI
jgi:hypothetical protein